MGNCGHNAITEAVNTMGKNRIFYLLALAGGVIFYIAYRQWMGWLLLVVLLCLPALSLLLTLPALFTLKLRLACPEKIPQGTVVMSEVESQCWFPVPIYDCRFEVNHVMTGKRDKCRLGEAFPTEHCGSLICRVEKAWAFDYLGLFRFYLGSLPEAKMTVWPREIPVEEMPRLTQQLPLAWKPKPGGGFSEHHELRLYRPGDHLNQIHWKLSAKTGKLIIREAMIPVNRLATVAISVTGEASRLDEKFGRLLGACRYLLERNIPFQIYAVTGFGGEYLPIDTEQALTEAVERLLEATPAESEQTVPGMGAWIYQIGGNDHE